MSTFLAKDLADIVVVNQHLPGLCSVQIAKQYQSRLHLFGRGLVSDKVSMSAARGSTSSKQVP